MFPSFLSCLFSHIQECKQGLIWLSILDKYEHTISKPFPRLVFFYFLMGFFQLLLTAKKCLRRRSLLSSKFLNFVNVIWNVIVVTKGMIEMISEKTFGRNGCCMFVLCNSFIPLETRSSGFSESRVKKNCFRYWLVYFKVHFESSILILTFKINSLWGFKPTTLLSRAFCLHNYIL